MEKLIDLSDCDINIAEKTSSKGNQIKWNIGDFWIKSDGNGYEGLSEYVVSHILMKSNVDDFCRYNITNIKYKENELKGCVSKNFVPDSYDLITLEKLGLAYRNASIGEFLARPGFAEDRIDVVMKFLHELKIQGVEKYMTTLMELDSLTLNDDRHTNNIAFLRKDNILIPAPIFDNGGAFLSNTMEYSMRYNPRYLTTNVSAKPFSQSFEKQKRIFEDMYGKYFKTSFSKNDLRACLDYASAVYTDDQILKRVEITFLEQMDKNKDLFVEETCKEELPKNFKQQIIHEDYDER